MTKLQTPQDAYNELIEEFGLELPARFIPRFTNKYVCLDLPSQHNTLYLAPKHLRQLTNRKRPSGIIGLHYYEHCGFSYQLYGEFILELHGFIRIDKGPEWPSEYSLIFLIGNALVEVGAASGPFCLLMEPIYSEEHIGQEEFRHLCTVRIMYPNQVQHKQLATKALYYLNSHYLGNIGCAASIGHLMPDYDPSDEEDVEVKFKTVSRKRIRRRPDFKSFEPLAFFNDASIKEGEEGFLNYYRVLEYFFQRYRENKLKTMRYDKSVPEKQIIDELRSEKEVGCMLKMLSDHTTPVMQNRLSELAYRHRLITKADFKVLVDELYKFRCSLVHSKEDKIESSLIPDQFVPNQKLIRWNYIIRILAKRIISILNLV